MLRNFDSRANHPAQPPSIGRRSHREDRGPWIWAASIPGSGTEGTEIAGLGSRRCQVAEDTAKQSRYNHEHAGE